MLRPSADQFALTIVDLPAKFITTFLFDVILYFMAGLQNSASQFFVFLLFTVRGSLTSVLGVLTVSIVHNKRRHACPLPLDRFNIPC